MRNSSLRIAGVGITPPVYKASGGIAAGIQLMCHVAESTDTCMYVMADRDEDVTNGKLRIHRRQPRNLFGPTAALVPRRMQTMAWRPAIRKWLAETKPHIVHVHNPHPPGALMHVAQTCESMGIPYVISTHGFIEFNDVSTGFGATWWQKPLIDRFVRAPVCAVARGAARVLMLSPLEKEVLTRMGVDPNLLRVITNGVDPYYLHQLQRSEREALVARFALPKARPLLLFVGNHTENKGLRVLLRSVTLMERPAVAVIAGAIRSRGQLDSLMEANGLRRDDPRVLFTDFVTRKELRALYQSATLFVFPSLADTLPLVILEAMASSLPVVASSVGGIPFQVTANTGKLVEPGDAVALAAALDALCGDPDRCRALGAEARERVSREFDWRESARRCVAVYREVIDQQE